MRLHKLLIVSLIAFAAFQSQAAFAQELTKPQIGKIVALPADEPLQAATCTASWSGYLEINGRIELTEAEIGKFVASSLRDGYVLTIYPESKNGVFVDMTCPATPKPTNQKP